MKKNKKIIVSAFSVFALILNLFLPAVAWAYSISLGILGTPNIDVNAILREANYSSVSQLAQDASTDMSQSIEERYGFNEDIWRNAQRKETAPKVELFFDNTNPKPGEKVTAHAIPEFFKNDPQNLYYTWYIIHEGDTGDDAIRNGKIEAARIGAHADYDPNLDGQSYNNPDSDPDGDGWPDVDRNSYEDNEGKAPYGGADGTGQRCFRHKFGTNYDVSSGSDDSGIDISISCDHKWTNASSSGASACTADDCTSGSGKFPTGEERYWKTDPTDPDTDGDGFPDEADVIGLGQQDFTWNYRAGDRVGVVVEGTSLIPIDESSAYYKIMWGYLDICDSTKASLVNRDECNDSSDNGFGYLATQSPSEQGEDKLKVSLAYSPDTPIADPNSENILDDGTIADADQITVVSSLDNTDLNPSNLYYSWQIQRGDPQSDTWTEIRDIPGNFSTTSPASGMGISEFSFIPKTTALASNSGINYFKVTLTVSKASDVKAGSGRSSVIIPVNTQGVKIVLHKVDIQDGRAVVGDSICDEGLYRNLCPVVKGQMLAAEAVSSHYTSANSQFAWQVDNNSISPPANVSDLFAGWSNTTIFFPITKGEQEIENISVTATRKDELQPSTATRLATVVHPAVFIKSADSSVSWPKTYTAESNLQANSSNLVESSNAFQVLSNTDASFYLDFVPDYLLTDDENTVIDWSINGTSISDVDFYSNNLTINGIETSNNQKQIIITTPQAEGEYFTLSADVKKYWSEDERNIAYTTWGVAPNTLWGETSVSVETVLPTEGDESASANTPGQILAAIGTHLPHYFMYLLRLVLTIAVMFVLSAVFYGLTQRLNFADDEK